MWSSRDLAASSSSARNGPPKSESQHNKNNMKQNTVLHIHVNNYTGNMHKPPRQDNRRSSGYQGQNQTKATVSSANPQYSRQAQNLQKTSHQGVKNWQKTNHGQGSNKQLGQGHKQYSTHTNQRPQNSNSKNQDYKQNKQTPGNGSNTAKKVVVVKTTKIINTKTIIKK